MAKKDIHPDYHKITVKLTNGETFETYSTYGKENGVLQLDVDPTTHPAWTGGTGFVNENASRIADFNKRFAGLDFMSSSKKKAEVSEDAKEEETKA